MQIVLYQGVLTSGVKISLVRNGTCPRFGIQNVGTVPAAVSAHCAISGLQPDYVISPGTCGCFKSRGVKVLDVVLC